MRSAQLALVGLALVVVNAAVAADRNLLSNGDFSQQNQLTGWSCLPQTWSSDDAASNPASGSMALAPYFNTADGYCTSACIAVRPGAAYSFGGQSRVVSGNFVVTFACAEDYSSAQCRSFTYNLQGPAMSTASTWNSTPAVESGILSSTTQSLFCKVDVHGLSGGIDAVHFDNLFFTTDVIFAEAFDAP